MVKNLGGGGGGIGWLMVCVHAVPASGLTAVTKNGFYMKMTVITIMISYVLKGKWNATHCHFSFNLFDHVNEDTAHVNKALSTYNPVHIHTFIQSPIPHPPIILYTHANKHQDHPDTLPTECTYPYPGSTPPRWAPHPQPVDSKKVLLLVIQQKFLQA